jgi:hypothetical protein
MRTPAGTARVTPEPLVSSFYRSFLRLLDNPLLHFVNEDILCQLQQLDVSVATKGLRFVVIPEFHVAHEPVTIGYDYPNVKAQVVVRLKVTFTEILVHPRATECKPRFRDVETISRRSSVNQSAV